MPVVDWVVSYPRAVLVCGVEVEEPHCAVLVVAAGLEAYEEATFWDQDADEVEAVVFGTREL